MHESTFVTSLLVVLNLSLSRMRITNSLWHRVVATFNLIISYLTSDSCTVYSYRKLIIWLYFFVAKLQHGVALSCSPKETFV